MIILNKNKKLNCSITVETAIVFTLCILLLFMNLGPMFICKTSSDIITKLDTYSKNLCYLKEIEADENVKNVSELVKNKLPFDINIDLKDDNTEGILNLINTSIVMFMLLKDNDNHNNPFSNIKDIDTNNFEVYDEEKGTVKYDFDVFFDEPLNVFNVVPIKENFVAYRRAFIGSDGNRQYQNKIASLSNCYYVARDYDTTKVYHKFIDCSYLIKNVTKEKYNNVKTAYNKCSFCIKNNMLEVDTIVYITETGDCFHINPDCPSMTAYVKKVDEKFLEDNNLRICSRCSGKLLKNGGGE